MPLTNPQRAILTSLDEAKQIVEQEVEKYNNILRAVRNWDAGTASFLIPEELTDAQVIAAARTRLNAQRLTIIAAADAIPEI